MNTDEKIDYAIKLLLGMDLRLAALEKLAAGYKPEAPPADDTPPKPTGGLYDFVRPVPVEPRYGAGVKMTSPAANEALLRAKYAVRWNGDVMLTVAQEDEVWAEIEALKGGDQKLIAKYSMLDPEFAGFALLTNLLDVSQYDGFLGQSKRDAYSGETVETFIALQFGIDSKPSGDE